MRHCFHMVDVFSPQPFGGNQLAVVTKAERLSTDAMQKIAREFNFAETTFVLAPEDRDNTCRVRIFTPKAELAFAGHPTLGTACVLAMETPEGSKRRLLLEEKAGIIPVDVERIDGVLYGTLTLPGVVETPGNAPAQSLMASVLSLAPQDVVEVFFASVGVAFCYVRLASSEAVDCALLDKPVWKSVLGDAWSPNVFVFAGDTGRSGELYARMFAPALGVEEDPATGSAAAALVGALSARPGFVGKTLNLSIRQGVAMGRPGVIEALARKQGSVLQSISVRGAASYVASGEIEAPP
jgi:trans-2,3-dihydro-3-hydroxyanthranilate isomerase